MHGIKMFFQKFFSDVPDSSYEDFNSQDSKPIHVARVRIDDWFGKEHRVPELAIASFYSPVNPVL